jgi:hypothetical protein
MKISVLVPSRERVKNGKFPRLINSILQTVSNPNLVNVWVYVDEDDPEVEEYKKFSSDIVNILVGPAKSVSQSWNDLCFKSDAEILMMGNDDQVYITEGWDCVIEEAAAKYKDDIYCMWVNDNYKKEKQCCFPIVSRKWVEILGYFTPGVFNFGYNDTWIFDLGKKLNRLQYIDDVVVEHRHFTKHSGEADNTTQRNRTGPKGNLYAVDQKIWEQTEYKREEDYKKLKKCLDENRNI